MTPTSSKKIEFDFDALKWRGLTVTQIQFWEGCFPDCDVIKILTKKMPAWLNANPSKAKKSNWKRFIVNWLAREQERYEQFKR